VNAALNIADRYLSGESRSREHTDGNVEKIENFQELGLAV
jgi:transposase